jgi:hypothetical protein
MDATVQVAIRLFVKRHCGLGSGPLARHTTNRVRGFLTAKAGRIGQWTTEQVLDVLATMTAACEIAGFDGESLSDDLSTGKICVTV